MKSFAKIWSAVFMMALLCAAGFAQVAPESDFTVELNKAGDGITITGYKGKATALVIPATIQGMPVKEILYKEYNILFSGCKSVEFPDSIEKISFYTGSYMTVLQSPIFSPNLTTSVKLPASLKVIPDYCFYGCKNLKSVKIPNGVTSIGRKAFEGCESLASIEIPESVKSIEKEAFKYCANLKKVKFPEKNKITIDFGAFTNTGIAELKITGNMQLKGGNSLLSEVTFTEMDSLKTVTVAADVIYLPDSLISSKTLEKVTFESAATGIKENTFSSCPNLTIASQAEIRKHNVNTNESYKAALKTAMLPLAEEAILSYVQEYGPCRKDSATSIGYGGNKAWKREYDSAKDVAFEKLLKDGKIVEVKNGDNVQYATPEKVEKLKAEAEEVILSYVQKNGSCGKDSATDYYTNRAWKKEYDATKDVAFEKLLKDGKIVEVKDGDNVQYATPEKATELKAAIEKQAAEKNARLISEATDVMFAFIKKNPKSTKDAIFTSSNLSKYDDTIKEQALQNLVKDKKITANKKGQYSEKTSLLDKLDKIL